VGGGDTGCVLTKKGVLLTKNQKTLAHTHTEGENKKQREMEGKAKRAKKAAAAKNK
jgi:hypothetical protein